MMGMKTSHSVSRRTNRSTDHVRERVRAKAVRAAPRTRRSYSEKLIASLNHVVEESMSWMGPGDILLLEGAASLRDFVDSVFYAILACPLCGKLDLITQRQYSGTEPVICGHSDCACHFRIDQRHRLTYLPVN
jgi:hypothetical protein